MNTVAPDVPTRPLPARAVLDVEQWLLNFDDGDLSGPFESKDEALAAGAAAADSFGPDGVIRSWNATPLVVDAAGLLALVARLRCRCGRMVLEPAPGCAWHEARAERADRDRRVFGSVEL